MVVIEPNLTSGVARVVDTERKPRKGSRRLCVEKSILKHGENQRYKMTLCGDLAPATSTHGDPPDTPEVFTLRIFSDHADPVLAGASGACSLLLGANEF